MEVACQKSITTYGGREHQDLSCDEWGPIHLWQNNRDDVKGCAIAIAYESNVHNIKPEDFTVISTNRSCPYVRDVTFEIPGQLRECPPGGCHCMWGWVHSPMGGGEEIYFNGFRCQVTGANANAPPMPRAQPPKKCADGGCQTGAKQPIYWIQNEGNNIYNEAWDPPYYNEEYGYANGAQNDIWGEGSGSSSGNGSGNGNSSGNGNNNGSGNGNNGSGNGSNNGSGNGNNNGSGNNNNNGGWDNGNNNGGWDNGEDEDNDNEWNGNNNGGDSGWGSGHHGNGGHGHQGGDTTSSRSRTRTRTRTRTRDWEESSTSTNHWEATTTSTNDWDSSSSASSTSTHNWEPTYTSYTPSPSQSGGDWNNLVVDGAPSNGTTTEASPSPTEPTPTPTPSPSGNETEPVPTGDTCHVRNRRTRQVRVRRLKK
jgi:hypothetical protein